MPGECCDTQREGDSCCSTETALATSEGRGDGCPVCHDVGKPVQVQTVRAMLALSLHEVGEIAYRFCRTPGCPVVYYGEDGVRNFTVEHVRESVYQKEPANPEVLVCYCFRHTAREIMDGTVESQRAIVDDITRGIQAGQCACDLRNPQGACCLGNVRALVQQQPASSAAGRF